MCKSPKKAIVFLIIASLMAFLRVTSTFSQEKDKWAYKMMDPGIDDPSKEWCYLAKSTTVIGLPFQPDVTAITYDGALYTGYVELCFFYGKENKPLLARQKTFLNGWIPIVQYDWSEGDISYSIEMFAASLDGPDMTNTVNFVKVKMKNEGGVNNEARFTAAVRGKSTDYRAGQLKGFSENSIFRMTENASYRDGRLLVMFPEEAAREAVPGVYYQKPFRAKDLNIGPAAACCCAKYSYDILPGQEKELVFMMPRVPVPDNSVTYIRRLSSADYNSYKRQIVRYWEDMFDNETTFSIPEKRIRDAQKASLVHLALATRTMEGSHKSQTDGLPYPWFFLTSMPQMVLAYLSNGQPELAKLSIMNAIGQQEEDGLYFDRILAHGIIIPAAHGHVMYAATSYYLYTRDAEAAKIIFPSLQRAVKYLQKSMKEDEYGLLPPAYPYDNEMIMGHYTSNNLWTLLGLRFAIRLAEDIGENETADEWREIEKGYSSNILKGIEVSAKEDGYVPTGLYPYLTGDAARKGFSEYSTDNDWENMLLSYPAEILAPSDPRVKGTLNHVRKGYSEGIMTYRKGMHLHQYITANLVEQYMVMGDTRQALIDFYHLILHSGSTHEGFENLVRPWTDRQVEPECPPPHAWAAAKTAFLIRNFLIHEFGGKGGIEPGKRDLYLFSVLSPAWTVNGEKISMNNAPCEMGKVTASMEFNPHGARVYIRSSFSDYPGSIRIRVPYFKKLVTFRTDARASGILGDCITLSPDVTYADITWEDNPEAHRGNFEDLLLAYRSTDFFAGVDSLGYAIVKRGDPFLTRQEKKNELRPLSFSLVQEAFTHEYKRRVEEHFSQGKLIDRIIVNTK
jgi:hypothetical protein